ncbi:MAG: FHA domain-containing protein [Chloroflexi bacterium]|nr:FHA domain-containing protein [Chloroflexota bacterium]MBV9595843.1 FHA domain-containing protein [Chloroflexota bacterium]
MDVVDLLIFALRLLLVALLYLFLFAVLRLAITGMHSSAHARPDPAQRLRLQVIEAGESTLSTGQTIEVADGSTLGRGDRADMPLGDTAISAEHAQVRREGRKWVVTDLGSTNGTRLNDKLVNGRASLKEGDVLALGTVRLQVLPRAT